MKHRFPSLLSVTLCGLAPAVLGHFLDWSPWLWGFMSTVTASGSLLLVTLLLGGGRAPADPHEREEPEPPAEPSYREARVVEAALPSATHGYDFLFSATVWWRPGPGHADRADGTFPALATSSVVSRAAAVVRREEPDRANFARYLLEGELSVPLQDRNGRVEALAGEVTLTLAPADRERLRKLDDLRKDEEIREYERQHERNKRRYLGDDVLKSAGSAVVWWLSRHEDEIEKAVDMIGPLARITAAANDEEVPELFRRLLVPPVGARTEATAGAPPWDGRGHEGGVFGREEEPGISDRLVLLLTAVGLKPDMDGYTVLVHRVVRDLEAEGLDEAAEEIRRTLLPASAEEDDGEPSDDGDFPGPWPPRTEKDAGTFTPETAEGGTGTFTPGAPESGADEWDREEYEASEGDMAPPYFWDTSHSPHRPTVSAARDQGED